MVVVSVPSNQMFVVDLCLLPDTRKSLSTCGLLDRFGKMMVCLLAIALRVFGCLDMISKGRALHF